MAKYRAILFHHLPIASLATMFILAGVIKLAKPQALVVTIKAVGLIPGWSVGLVAVALPCLEVLAGLMLLVNPRWGLGLASGLLGLFMGILFYALALGLDIDCGCYGPSDPETEAFGSIHWALWRDAFMLLVVIWLYLYRKRQ